MSPTDKDWVWSVLRCTADAVIVSDVARRVTYINPAACRLTCWEAAEAEGKLLPEILPLVDERTGSPIERPAEKAMREGHAVGLPEHTALINRQGGRVPIEDSTSPIHDDQGTLRGTVIVFRDVTGRRQAEREREELLSQLRERDERKNEFLAMLAHELRNPLSSVDAAVQYLRMDHISPDHIEDSKQTIERQVRHLARLIDDLLDVSRINRGKIELRIEGVSVSSIIDDAVDAVRPLVEEKGQRLSISYAPGSPTIQADPVRLDQVLVNLLSNAAKYTHPGGNIWFSSSSDDQHISFRIKDDGMGIPPGEIAGLFELFAQGRRSRDRSAGGLGIGLTVARRITELHGGALTASSEGPGKGSEFTVVLPLAAPHAGSPAIASPEPLAGKARFSRILIVDDNVELARGLSRLLALLGHEIFTVHDGAAAIALACRELPEVVLLDIGLPGMDGYEVAARLRREPGMGHALLIAITGYGQEEDRRMSLAVGFDHHMVKPIDYNTLITIIGQPASC